MNRTKRAASLFMSAAIAFSGIAATQVSAVVDSNVLQASGYSKNEKAFVKMVRQMILERDQSEVDISEYNLSYDDVAELYGTVVFNEPDFFYVSPVTLNLGYRSKNHVITFQLEYIYTESETRSIQKKIDKKADELLSGVKSSWSDLEKVIYVHDYLCANIDYYEGSNIFKGRSIYDSLVNGSAVCVGYSLTFQYFMDKLDIPCISITSETHMWNMVKLGSDWYHVDLTWDDSADFSDGFLMHDLMLMSYDQLRSLDPEHEIPYYALPATSKKYDNVFWNKSYSSMVYYNNYWYYTTADGLYRYSFSSGKSSLLYKFTEKWSADSDYMWTISFSTPVELNGKIYFNSNKTVLSYDTATGKTSVANTPKLDKGFEIYDLKYDGNKLIICSGHSAYYPNEQINSIAVKKNSVWSVSTVTALKAAEKNKVLSLKWNEVNGAEKYIVYRKSGGKIYKVAETAKTSISLKSKDSYSSSSFAVKVQTSSGISDYSEWVSVN